jgi:hypothetical protein
MVSWEWIPFSFLILVTALKLLDREQREAAANDGAGPIAQFFSRRRSDHGARLADAKAAGAWSHLRRGEVGRGYASLIQPKTAQSGLPYGLDDLSSVQRGRILQPIRIRKEMRN